jgi:hypothetical protein
MAKPREMVMDSTGSFLLRFPQLGYGVLLLLSAFGLLQAKASSKGMDTVFNWTPPVLSRMDSLFIIAATGEPRFKTLRDSCEKILVADSGTPAYLLAHRLTGQTPRQRHYVERLFTAIADSGRRPIATQKIGLALPGVPDTIKAQLLHIGSELGDPAFLPIAKLYLNADSEQVRKSAVRSLGLYPQGQDQAYLMDRVQKTKGLERQVNLWALNRQGPIKNWSGLLPILKDEKLYNRQLARRIISESCQNDWPQIEKLMPPKIEPQDRLEWILLAFEMHSPKARHFIKQELNQLQLSQQKFLQAMLIDTTQAD